MDIEEAKEQLLKHKKEIDVKFISARYSKAIEVVLSELDKKDEIINLIAKMLVKDHEWFYSKFDNYTKQDFIEYFTNKVEENK